MREQLHILGKIDYILGVAVATKTNTYNLWNFCPTGSLEKLAYESTHIGNMEVLILKMNLAF